MLCPIFDGLLDEVEVLLADEVEFFEDGRNGELVGDVFIQILLELFFPDGLVVIGKHEPRIHHNLQLLCLVP